MNVEPAQLFTAVYRGMVNRIRSMYLYMKEEHNRDERENTSRAVAPFHKFGHVLL